MDQSSRRAGVLLILTAIATAVALVDSDAVRRKRAAAEHWCQQRGMKYQIATIY